MLIGILICGHFVRQENVPYRDYDALYAEMLKDHGLTFRGWNVVDMDFPESVHEADGWLVSGSRHGAYESLPFIEPLEDFIRDAYAKDVPQVGICFGHQIIAQALGGKVEKFSRGWAAGHTKYKFDDGADMILNAFHQDQVTLPPSHATTIATNDFCEHAAFAYKGNAFSIQPHPEFGEPEMKLLLEERAPKIMPSQIIESAKSRTGWANDNTEMAERIAAFLKGDAHV